MSKKKIIIAFLSLLTILSVILSTHCFKKFVYLGIESKKRLIEAEKKYYDSFLEDIKKNEAELIFCPFCTKFIPIRKNKNN
jgi:hypothetical protein